MTPEEYREMLERLGRPTISSLYRFQHNKQGWHAANRYMTMDGSSYLWHRMDYMRDTYKLLWTPQGAVKKTYTT